jgi:hypothetical protein
MEEITQPVKTIQRRLKPAMTAVSKLLAEFRDRSNTEPKILELDAAWIHHRYFQDTERVVAPNEIYWLLKYAADAFSAVALLVQTKMDESEQQAVGEGFAWNIWSFQLGQMLEDLGLPFEIRKDAGKRKPSQLPSPFVRFVVEIQKYLPSSFTKYIQSTDALEQGLYRARKYCEEIIQAHPPLIFILPNGQLVEAEVVESDDTVRSRGTIRSGTAVAKATSRRRNWT